MKIGTLALGTTGAILCPVTMDGGAVVWQSSASTGMTPEAIWIGYPGKQGRNIDFFPSQNWSMSREPDRVLNSIGATKLGTTMQIARTAGNVGGIELPQ